MLSSIITLVSTNTKLKSSSIKSIVIIFVKIKLTLDVIVSLSNLIGILVTELS
jgi:hypothetical protein